MFTTYQAMRDMIVECNQGSCEFVYELPTDFVSAFRSTGDERIIAAYFVKNFQLFLKASNGFYLVDADTKATMMLEELWKALLNYDEAQGAFTTLLVTYIIRRLSAENKAAGGKKRRADFDDELKVNLADVTELSEYDEYKTELLDYIYTTELGEKEREYCEIVISENHLMKDPEIAELMGVSKAYVGKIRKSIQSKFTRQEVAKIKTNLTEKLI